MRVAELVAALCLWSSACGPTDSQGEMGDGTDSDSDDLGGQCATDGLEPSDPCLPRCGNDLGVGEPCSRGGGECNDNSSAILCTVDFEPDVVFQFCTKPCVADEDCGFGAVCGVNPDDDEGARGCVPITCT